MRVHFVGEVGIGMARVEKVGAVLELGFLFLQLRKLGFALFEGAMITAPGEDSVRSGNRMTGERPNHDQRERRRRGAAYQTQAFRSSPIAIQ